MRRVVDPAVQQALDDIERRLRRLEYSGADADGFTDEDRDVPTGGASGQVLTKKSGADYDAGWETPAAGGGTSDHTLLSNIGVNTHAQIDTHLGSTSNPHSVAKSDVGLGNVPNLDTTDAVNNEHAESHSVASHSDTSATGAELDELTDGSTTTLHSHAAVDTYDTFDYMHLKMSGAQSLASASNGSTFDIEWGTQDHIDTGTFTHSTSSNSEQVTVEAAGRYQIIASVSIQQGGGARTTFQLYPVVDGVEDRSGCSRNYSRGSGYGDTSMSLTTEVDADEDDVIELRIRVDDSDSTYTHSTIAAESEWIMRRIG
jgi:hypothetical protein